MNYMPGHLLPTINIISFEIRIDKMTRKLLTVMSNSHSKYSIMRITFLKPLFFLIIPEHQPTHIQSMHTTLITKILLISSIPFQSLLQIMIWNFILPIKIIILLMGDVFTIFVHPFVIAFLDLDFYLTDD